MSEFIKKTTIGDKRQVWKFYKHGQELTTDTGVVEITKDCWVRCTEEFTFKYPSSKQEPVWVMKSWDFGTATDKDPNPPKTPEPEDTDEPKQPWYRRWFGGEPKIPRARVVSE